MDTELEAARQQFIQGLSRISAFWGFPKAMGAIYGVIYLSMEPIGLDAIVAQVGLSKGAVSTNARHLERLGMIHKHLKIGDRRDYYTAEDDFWKIVRGILREREKPEFDLALKSVGQSLELVTGRRSEGDSELAAFYENRLRGMEEFFNLLDKVVAALISLERFHEGSILKLLGRR